MTFEEASEKIWVDYSPYTEGWGDVSFAESHGYTEYTRSDIAKADWYMRAEIKRLEQVVSSLEVYIMQMEDKIDSLEKSDD
jgi:hypothetical protein